MGNPYLDKSIINEIRSKKNVLSFKKEQLEKLKKEKDSLKKDINSLTEEKSELENVIFTCKIILEKITYNSKVKLEEFLTDAIRSIFTDRDYKIELVMREDTKKPALELTLTEGGKRQEITDAVGGGIISTLGLLTQIYYIEVFNLNKIMFIDEGLKEISTGLNNESRESVNYLDNLLRFLKWLSEEKKYSLVIVTHDNTVRRFANRVYEVDLGEVRECQITH